MKVLFISLLLSAFISTYFIRFFQKKPIGVDPVGGGPQKFHVRPVPRLGGVAIIFGLFGAGLVLDVLKPVDPKQYWLLLIASFPAFLGGLLEDITKKVGASVRLLFTFVSASLGIFFLQAIVLRVDIPLIDPFFSIYAVAFVFTLIAVGGIANAINIIDGFNGVAGVVSLLILSAIGYVAYLVGDNFVVYTCLAVNGAILGFLLWNYPWGMIFLGDAGAYLLGFLIAELSVLLVGRNPDVSAWFPMVLVIYPVTETLFSIYRKKFLRGQSPAEPDGLHFHMLIYKRVLGWMVGSKEAKYKVKRNSMTAPYLWALTLTSILPSVILWRNTIALIFFSFLFIILYAWLYWRIVRFKTPRFLHLRGLRDRI